MTRELTETEKTILVLDQAKELISDPARWCKGDMHKADPERWCMVGAIDHVVPMQYEVDEDGQPLLTREAGKALVMRAAAKRALEKAIGDYQIESFNDARHRKHKQVMQAFDRAIKLLRKKQP